MENFEMYTDGACSGNPGPGGWAWVLVLNGKLILQDSGYEKETTNNRMELLAVINGLQNLITTKQEKTSLVIYTDSNYVKQGITTWIKTWKKNGWKTSNKQPVKNKDLWETLDTLQQEFSPNWQWVKGHSANELNNLCDKLAVEAYIQKKTKKL